MLDGVLLALYKHRGYGIPRIPSLKTPTVSNHEGMIILMEDQYLGAHRYREVASFQR